MTVLHRLQTHGTAPGPGRCRSRPYQDQNMVPGPPPPPTSACSNTGGRGAGPPTHLLPPSPTRYGKSARNYLSSLIMFFNQRYVITTLCLLFLTSSLCEAKEVFTNHFYVKIHPEAGEPDPSQLAHKIAKRNGFHNLGPLLGSDHEFHFIHHGLPHARHKRSVPHSRKLKSDPQVRKFFWF